LRAVISGMVSLDRDAPCDHLGLRKLGIKQRWKRKGHMVWLTILNLQG
jgi:hypothetical protein